MQGVMDTMDYVAEDSKLTIRLEGRLDATNADKTDDELRSILASHPTDDLTIDVEDLEYIASAGLRMFIRLLKERGSLVVVNASPDVYDIFEMTGITQLMDVRRAMRTISIDGLEMIGAGANGWVYRLDEERIVKVYNPLTNPPEKIVREKQVAREAFIAGIPSALSFDMVRVGDGYGIIYEMIDANTLGETIAREPERLEEYATRMAHLLQELHATEFAPGTLPDARTNLHTWVDVAERSGYYTDTVISAAREVVDAIPPRNTFIHGDFHPGNIMVTSDDELLLIDMGDASVGDPLIDLLGSYQIMRIAANHPGGAERYMNLTMEQANCVWDTFIRTYYGIDNPEQQTAIERKLRYYVILRNMAGVTFSEIVPDNEREMYAEMLSKALLRGVPGDR